MIICVDFDNTIVDTNGAYEIKGLRPRAKEILNKWHSKGHYIIINTLRQGDYLKEASGHLDSCGVKYDLVNANMPLMEKMWGKAPNKIGADMYIDDRNLVPLTNWTWIDWCLRLWDRKVARRKCKPRILCIVGESGSGKTCIAEYILKRYGVPMIESYTDRPRRTKDEVGHTFVSAEEFDTFSFDDMIAFTKFGTYRYCCLRGDVRAVSTYVIDEDGLDMLKAKHSDDFDIVSLRAYCPDGVLSMRTDYERRMRDDGRFTKELEEFDFVVWTANSFDSTYEQVDLVMRQFLNFKSI